MCHQRIQWCPRQAHRCFGVQFNSGRASGPLDFYGKPTSKRSNQPFPDRCQHVYKGHAQRTALQDPIGGTEMTAKAAIDFERPSQLGVHRPNCSTDSGVQSKVCCHLKNYRLGDSVKALHVIQTHNMELFIKQRGEFHHCGKKSVRVPGALPRSKPVRVRMYPLLLPVHYCMQSNSRPEPIYRQ